MKGLLFHCRVSPARVAMVGTPCQIRTVRKMQVLGVIPADMIKSCFGLFCWENFLLRDIERNRLGRKYEFQIDEEDLAPRAAIGQQ